jgi:hypothetical protein
MEVDYASKKKNVFVDAFVIYVVKTPHLYERSNKHILTLVCVC